LNFPGIEEILNRTLAHHSTLVSLQLSNCILPFRGTRLTSALYDNQTLTSLDLSGYFSGKPMLLEELNEFVVALHRNFTLHEFRFTRAWGEEFDESEKLIHALTTRNKEIQERLSTEWSKVSILTAFMRANSRSALRCSVLPLVSTIMERVTGVARQERKKNNEEERQALLFSTTTTTRVASTVEVGAAGAFSGSTAATAGSSSVAAAAASTASSRR